MPWRREARWPCCAESGQHLRRGEGQVSLELTRDTALQVLRSTIAAVDLRGHATFDSLAVIAHRSSAAAAMVGMVPRVRP